MTEIVKGMLSAEVSRLNGMFTMFTLRVLKLQVQRSKVIDLSVLD